MDKSLTERIGLYLESLPPPAGRTFHQMQPKTLLSECRTMIDLQAGVIINYQNRIADLETALGHIYAWYPISVTQPRQTINDIREFARDALGEKKDG